MPISPKKQKELQNEQPGKNSSQELKEKEKRQQKAAAEVSKNLGQVEKNIRDAGGRVVLFQDKETGNAVDLPNQHITVKLTTPVYDEEEVGVVIDNVVDELLPKKRVAPTEITLAERIRKFFVDYEQLRDPIWSSNEMANQDSHKYLVKQSKTYLPIPKVPLKYDGDIVGTKGEGQLMDGNIIKLREAVFLPAMKGYKIDLYGLTKKVNPVLLVKDILTVIITKLNRLGVKEIDPKQFTSRVKRALLAKYETSQVKFKQLSELEAKLVEVFDEIYPNMEKIPLEGTRLPEPEPKPKTVVDKVARKQRKKRAWWGKRRKKGVRYMNPRNKIRRGKSVRRGESFLSAMRKRRGRR